MNTYCLDTCAPEQIVTLDYAVDDFSLLRIFNGRTPYCNECIKWAYSTDGVIWSCWMSYDEAANILFESQTDYYIRAKVKGGITSLTYDNNPLSDYNTSLATCFDFSSLQNVANNYNPYANLEGAVGLYQYLTDSISNTIGIPIYYIKLTPNIDSRDFTFKEYALMGVEAVKQIKLMVQDGMMPSSKPEFSEFGFDFSTDWETEISKSVFASAFGNTAKPMEGDLIYIPMMKRMWMVNGAYEEKNEGFMWQSSTFKVALVKYEDKGSVDLGDAQEFVDSLVKTKYDDLFGNDENIQSGQLTVESPAHAADPLYPIFESDAIRKYVKMTIQSGADPYKSLNTRLISSPKYSKGIVIAENMYDWTGVSDEAYIIYQHPYCGTDLTLSCILTLGNRYCQGTIFSIGNIDITIDLTPTVCYIKVFELGSIKLDPNKTYFVIIRWSKGMNLLELSAVEYSAPSGMPAYMVQPFHMNFDVNNMKSSVYKYDIELEVYEKSEVTTYSFDGKITNIKLYDTYIDDNSELLQMLPTNQHLLINDVARKFVELPGSYTR